MSTFLVLRISPAIFFFLVENSSVWLAEGNLSYLLYFPSPGKKWLLHCWRGELDNLSDSNMEGSSLTWGQLQTPD